MKIKYYILLFVFALIGSANFVNAQVDIEPEVVLPDPCIADDDLGFFDWGGVADPCAIQLSLDIYNLMTYNANNIIVLGVEWNYGDGQSVILDYLGNPIHSYAGPGTYEVCATIWTTNGVECCKTTYCEMITVESSICNICDEMDELELVMSGSNPFVFTVGGDVHPKTLSKIGIHWDYGDGTYGASNYGYPKTYEDDGTYLLKLTLFYFDAATGTCCSRVITQRIIVSGGLIQEDVDDGIPNGSSAISANSNELSIYPNPSNGTFTMNAPLNITIENITVYDAIGNVVHNEVIANPVNGEVLNLEFLEKGIYFVIINKDEAEKSASTMVLID